MVAGHRIIRFSEDILEDLSAFTGVSQDKIINYFDNSRIDNTKYELFEIIKPGSRQELVWYYRAARAEFIHNATKYNDTNKGWPLINKWVKRGNAVLDYGAGTGQNCIYLWREIGAIPYYFEISILQAEFFKFRSKKRGFAISIIEPYYLSPEGEYKFDPIKAIYGVYDVVLMSQVLEHIPEPEELLTHLVGTLTNDGLLLEDTPWSSHNYEALVSLAAIEFEYLMVNKLKMKKLSHGVWKKCSKSP